MSWVNIQMMLTDAVKTDYKSEVSRKQTLPETIDMNDSRALESLRTLAGQMR